MSVNSSSSSSGCLDSRAGLFVFMSFTVTKNFLLLPLSVLVLYLGHQRCRRRRSFSSSSHSDVFTFHAVALELLAAFGGTVFTFGGGHKALQTAGSYMSFLVFPGQICLHLLTCVERYLAVVHPVTYLGLRKGGGVRIRNVSLACAWLLSFGWSALIFHSDLLFLLPCVGALVLCIVVCSFCSLRVLCVLIRPGPGEGGGDRERVDQSKQRALCTVLVIMGVLWSSLTGVLVALSLSHSPLLSADDQCAMSRSVAWFSLPCSLVLPLLFLHKAGKLLN